MAGYNPKYPEDMYNREHKLLFFRYSLAVERALDHYKEIVHGTFRENPKWPCGIEVKKLPSIVSYLPTATRRKVLNVGGQLRERTQSLYSDFGEVSNVDVEDIVSDNRRKDTPIFGQRRFSKELSDIEELGKMSSGLPVMSKRASISKTLSVRNSGVQSKQSQRERSKNKLDLLQNKNNRRRPSLASSLPLLPKTQMASSELSSNKKNNLYKSFPGNLSNKFDLEHKNMSLRTGFHGKGNDRKWAEEIRRPYGKLPKIDTKHRNRKRRGSFNRDGPREPSLVVRDGSVILKEVRPEF